jgi:hypothetical protein
MRTLEHHFAKEQLKNPSLGDYSCMHHAVKGRDFSKATISRWFTILIGVDDYDSSDRRELIRQLVEASQNPLRTTKFD